MPAAEDICDVTVATFSTAVEAEIARGALDAEGITALVPDELAAAVLANAVGGVRLVVAQRDLAAAQAVLHEHFDGDGERTVYRMNGHRALEGGSIGGIIGTALGYLLVSGPLLAVFAIAGVLIGARLGASFRHVYCSNMSCAVPIPLAAAACPGCGYSIERE